MIENNVSVKFYKYFYLFIIKTSLVAVTHHDSIEKELKAFINVLYWCNKN